MGSIALGAYDMHQPLGQGGMGQVWAAVHRSSGVPVAVKILDGAHDTPRYREAFRNEARAMAGLSHPHVVWVLDYGEVDAPAVRSSGGQLRPRQPYLVMEQADRGSLLALRGRRLPFGRLRPLLLAILDGLAHAHARGVVHRDLKPSNVLLGGLRPGPKLADFGLAHIEARAHSDGVIGSSGGTPAYMAPEQFQDAWRDQGPWTDLYALGVVAWRLTTGRRLFEGNGFADLRRAHLEQAPPPLEPLAPVPEGFEAWLRTCLAKDPGNRFQRAADAAWALDQLGPAIAEPAAGEAGDRDAELLQRTTLIWAERTASTVRERYAEPGEPLGRSAPLRRALPPVPGRWVRGASQPPPLPLVGTGLRLFGLREVPLVAREAERDALWNVIRAVGRRGGVRAVVLRGAAGSGKSRLARWLCERAHEVGATTLLEASHAPIPGPLDGIGPMLARHHRCDDLSREEGLERIRSLRPEGAPDLESVALAEVIWPTTLDERAAGAPAVHFRTVGDRHRVVEQTICEADRPAAVWLDDVQWGLEALDLCAWLLERQRCTAALVLTVREEALAARPAEAAALEALCALDTVTEVRVGPLDPAGSRALVRQLLPLSEGLALRLEQRAGGSPLYAVQCVAHWVASNALELGADGFQLIEGAGVGLPDDLAQVWVTRIQRLLLDRPPADGLALELAAALGQEVDGAEWRAACAELGVTGDPGLVEALMVERLAGPGHSPTGFAFAHGMLREALERQARAGGRWAALNTACARVVQRAGGRGAAERLGRHLLEAGRHEEALEPLREAFDGYLEQDEHRQAERILGDWTAAWTALGGTDADPRSAPGRMRWILLRLVRLQADDAQPALQKLWDDHDRHGWPETPVRLWMLTGALHKARSEFDAAAECYETAKRLWAEQGEAGGVARACKNLAELHVLRGDHRQGHAVALEGLRAADARHDAYVASILSHIPAIIALREHRHDDAEHWAERCIGYARRVGNALVEAQALLVLAGVCEQRDDLAGAEAALRRAQALLGDQASVTSASVELSLVVLDIRRARFHEAGEALERILTAIEGRWRVLEAVAHLALAATAAALRELSVAASAWEQAARVIETSGYVDPDVAYLAGVFAAQVRPLQPELADAGDALRRSQERRLGGG